MKRIEIVAIRSMVPLFLASDPQDPTPDSHYNIQHFQLIMNRKLFLSRLLRVENTVQAVNTQDCLICKEEYCASLSTSDTSEVQIRLPCHQKHTVGSNCITIWLKDHNTCPVCRYEFFPAEKTESERPEILYLGLEDDDDMSDLGETSDDEDFLYEGGDTNDEDENMSDEDEVTSDEDEDEDDDVD